MQKNKGITLIALVVTIVVLLILAGVSISMLAGDNGIIEQAKKAKIETTHRGIYEAIELKATEYATEKQTGKYTKTLIDYLTEKEIISIKEGIDGYIINVEKLMGEKMIYGNGKDGLKDVYKLEKVVEEGVTGKTRMAALVSHPNSMPWIPSIAATSGGTYNVVYYGKNISEDVQLGKLVDGSGQEVTEQEKIEDMYYLEGSYNRESGKIETITLKFSLDLKDRILKENPDKFMTDEELVLKAAQEDGLTTQDSFEGYMQEIYDKQKLSTTPKDYVMNFMGYHSEEAYESYIEILRTKYDDAGTLTVEELVLKAAQEAEVTKTGNFEDFMQEVCNSVKLYTNAKDFFMYAEGLVYEGEFTEESYAGIIFSLRNYFCDITIEDADGQEVDGCLIGGMGQYEFVIKIDGEILKKLSISIDQYEILRAVGLPEDGYDYTMYNGRGILVYDFVNEKILTIDSGKCDYYLFNNYEKGTINISNNIINDIEEGGNYIDYSTFEDGSYDIEVESKGTKIKGKVLLY